MNTNTTNTNDSKKSAQFGAGDNASLQEKIMKQIRDLGDSIEGVGEKVEKSGWEMIGQAIYKLGNSLEHLQDKKSGEKNSSNQNSNNQSSGSQNIDGKVGGSGNSFGQSFTPKSVSGGTAGKAYSDREFDEKNKKNSDSMANATKVGGSDSQAY